MIEDIFNDLTKTNIAVGVVCLWILWNLVTRIDEERRIAAYGKHAPRVSYWLPYSMSSSSLHPQQQRVHCVLTPPNTGSNILHV